MICKYCAYWWWKKNKKNRFSQVNTCLGFKSVGRCLVCKDICQAWKISFQIVGGLEACMKLSVNTIHSVKEKLKWHSYPLTIVPSELLIHSIQPCNCQCSVYISHLTLLGNCHSGVLLLCTCFKWTQFNSPLDGPWHHSLIWERPFGGICINSIYT